MSGNKKISRKNLVDIYCRVDGDLFYFDEFYESYPWYGGKYLHKYLNILCSSSLRYDF